MRIKNGLDPSFLERIPLEIPSAVDPAKRGELSEKIGDPSDTTRITQKQFALMFGDTFIDSKGLEGGDPSSVAIYYLEELKQWTNHAAFSPEIQKDILSGFEEELNVFLSAGIALSVSNVSRLHQLVKERLAARGRVVLPAMVRGKGGLPGHVFSLVIESSEKGEVSFYFMNKGDGSQLHPTVRTSESGKEYVSYRSPSFVLGDHFFDGEKAEGFLNALSSFYHLSPPSNQQYRITSLDLYQRLQCFADMEKSKKRWATDRASSADLEDMGVTSQRSGTCPEHTIRLMMRDHLMRSGMNGDQIKKVIFNSKFRGLRNGLHTLSFDDTLVGRVNLSLLKKAAHGFSVQTDKLIEKGILTPEEAAAALVLIEEVHKKIAEVTALHERRVVLPEVQAIEQNIPNREPLTFEAPSIRAFSTELPEPLSSSAYPQTTTLLVEALQDPRKLTQALDAIRGDRSENDALFIAFLLKLPSPRKEEDPYWDNVDPSAYATLNYLMERRVSKYELSAGFAEERLLHFQTAAIMHKLLSRDPVVGPCLSHFPIRFDRSCVDSDFFYPDGNLETLDQNLKRYFEEVGDKNNPALLTKVVNRGVDIDPIIEDFVRFGGEETLFTGQLTFLKELISAKKLDTNDLRQLYRDLMVGDGKDPVTQLMRMLVTAQAYENCERPRHRIYEVAPYGKFQHIENDVSSSFNKKRLQAQDRFPISKPEDPVLQEKMGEKETASRENTALQKAQLAKQVGPDAAEGLLRLRSFDAFRILLFVEWCDNHADLLDKEEVQNYLTVTLLSAGVLEKATKFDPRSIDLLRNFLDKMIERNSTSDTKLKTCRFWVCLAAEVESRLIPRDIRREQQLDDRIGDLSILAYKNPKEALALLHLQLYMHSIRQEFNPSAFIRLQVKILLLSQKVKVEMPVWMRGAIERKQAFALSELKEALEYADLSRLNSALNLPKNTQWGRDYPRLVTQEYSIDLISRILTKGGAEATTIIIERILNLSDPIKKMILARNGSMVLAYNIGYSRGRIEACDGSFVLRRVDSNQGKSYELDLRLDIGGEEGYYRRMPPDMPIQGLPAKFKAAEKFFNPARPHQLVLMDDSFQPAYVLDVSQPHPFCIQRIRQGELTGEFVMPIEGSSIEEYLKECASQGDATLLCKKGSDDQLHLSEIEVGRLRFIPERSEGRTRLKFKAVPNSYLAKDQSIDPSLVGQAFWIENEQGKELRVLLLPYEQDLNGVRSPLSADFFTVLEKDRESKRESLNPEAPFIYSVNPKNGKLIGETNAATLYLASVYLSQERYLEALELLQSLQFHRALTESEEYLFKMIIDYGDMDPQACALKLHAVLILRETEKLLRRKKQKPVMIDAGIIQKNAQRYIAVSGSDQIVRVPAPLRLSEVQLRGFRKKEESKFPFTSNALYHQFLNEMIPKAFFNGREYFEPYAQAYQKIKSVWEICKTASREESLLALSELQVENIEDANYWAQIFAVYVESKNGQLKESLEMYLASEMKFSRPGSGVQSKYSEARDEILYPMGLLKLIRPTEKPVAVKQAAVYKAQRIEVSMPAPLYTISVENKSETTLRRRLPDEAEAFPISQCAFKPSSNVSSKLYESLQAAHAENREETIAVHVPIGGINVLKEEIQSERQRLKNQASETLLKLEKLANFPADEEMHVLPVEKRAEVLRYRLRQRGEQTLRLSLQDPLLRALLMGSPQEISERNPFLSPSQLEEIRQLSVHYLDLCNAEKRLETAEEHLSSDFSQSIELLKNSRLYNPYTDPEMALYEYATGFQLRKNQVDILKKITGILFAGGDAEQIQQLAFEFQAGGGKTKVISALLAARAIAEDKVPIFFSLPQLYDITREDFKGALAHIFQFKLTVIEFSIHEEISKKELTLMVDVFKEALEKKKALFMTPETWHALNLVYQRSIKEYDSDRRSKCEELFDLMKENGIALIDEAHVNAESLQQTNRAAGKPKQLPVNERKLITSVVRMLVEDDELRKLVQLRENNQTTISAEALKKAQEKIVDLMLFHMKEEIPEMEREEVRRYLLQPDEDYPPCLQRIDKFPWDPEKVHEAMFLRRIDLLRGIVNQLLPFVFSLSRGLDYKPPEAEATEIWVPAKQGQSSNALFQIPDISAIVSCIGVMQTGLTRAQLVKCIQEFHGIYVKEVHQEHSTSSKIAKTWDKMQEDSKVRKEHRFTLHEYDQASQSERDKMIENVLPHLSGNLDLIEHYLNHQVLTKVRIFPEKEQSTASQLVRAFHSSLLFSATLGTHEKYPLQRDPEGKHLRDLQFMDQVVTRACLPHQGSIRWVEDSTPQKLIDSLSVEEFNGCEGIINVGAFAEEYTSEEWADAFLEKAKASGSGKKAAIYFKEDENYERVLWLKIANEPEELYKVSGSDLKTLLKTHKLDISEVYKIYAPSETTGTDLPISPNARMLFTIGDNVDLSLAVQSIMRMRGFLKDPVDPAACQKLLWVGSPAFREKIRETVAQEEMTPQAFFAWALEKEAQKDESAILQQAIQEIDAIILEEVEAQRRKTHRMIKEAYTQTLGRDPVSSYGGANQLIPTEQLLKEHVQQTMEKDKINQLSEERQTRIDLVIQRAAAVISETKRRGASSLDSKMEQKTEEQMQQAVRQEQKAQQKENVNASGVSQVKHDLDYHQDSLTAAPIERAFAKHLEKPCDRVSAFFSEDLYFFRNAFSIDPQEEEPPTFIKQVDLILIQEINGVKKAFALSNYDAERFAEQFASRGENVPHHSKLCLLTASGKIAHSGPEGANFTPGEMADLIGDPWMQQKLREVAFWNGKIADAAWMEQQLDPQRPERRNQVIQAWAVISSKQANPAHLQKTLMEELINGKSDPIEAMREGDRVGAIEYGFNARVRV